VATPTMSPTERIAMLITTMNDVPGCKVTSVLARSSAVGNRMVAEAHGGNAVLAMRFDTSEMGGNSTEIRAYGTAVVIEPIE
jgi:hypothetical protein